MGKLNDIQIYWNLKRTWEFDEERMLDGKILLEDDGWFEGIVTNLRNDVVGDELVFGVYYPGKTIELMKVSRLDGNGPYFYRGKRDVKGYDGQFGSIGSTGEAVYGTTHIITRDVELFRDAKFPEVAGRDVAADTEDITQRIAAWKALDGYSQLYEETYAMRDQVVKAVLERYEGRPTSLQDTESVGRK